jgi:hypothetical protein
MADIGRPLISDKLNGVFEKLALDMEFELV